MEIVETQNVLKLMTAQNIITTAEREPQKISKPTCVVEETAEERIMPGF